MQTFIHALVEVNPGMGSSCQVWTTPAAHTHGVLPVNHRWVVVVPSPDEGNGDPTVDAALACAALGSRLLRLAREIDAQRSLFATRSVGGVDA